MSGKSGSHCRRGSGLLKRLGPAGSTGPRKEVKKEEMQADKKRDRGEGEGYRPAGLSSTGRTWPGTPANREETDRQARRLADGWRRGRPCGGLHGRRDRAEGQWDVLDVLECVPGEGGLSQPHASTGLPVATDSSDMAETQTGRTRTLPNDPWRAVGSTRLAACRVGRFSRLLGRCWGGGGLRGGVVGMTRPDAAAHLRMGSERIKQVSRTDAQEHAQPGTVNRLSAR